MIAGAASAALGLLAALLAAPASAIQIFDLENTQAPRIEAIKAFSFSDFVKKYNRTYAAGSGEWARREAIFGEKKKEVLAFLSGPEQSWNQGITQFADYEASEFMALLGYKGRRSSKLPEGAAFARTQTFTHPSAFSVHSESRKLAALVRDQGACGSCWAEAATATLEGQMEANNTIVTELRKILDSMGKTSQAATLSSQSMVSCTANPRNCGGSGGCDGATVELAYDMVKEHGMALAVEWSYESSFGSTPPCKTDVLKKASVGITGYEVLPSNKLHPLMQALYSSGGPIAVSVDATNWGSYSDGIFSDTTGGATRGGGDFTVNHAVTLTAYKMPKRVAGKLEQGYWLIKNSWGDGWGEDGFIRLEMKENEGEHCGIDKNTHAGLACDGDPDTAWVCGTCGVLYDSVYPTGVHLA